MNVGTISTGLIAGSVRSLDARSAVAERASRSVFSDIIQDKVTLSSSTTQAPAFSVTTPIEDYLPQGKHISTKKNFKNLKEYIAYLLLLFQKLDKIQTTTGSNFVRIEDKTEFAKLRNELDDLTQSDVLG